MGEQRCAVSSGFALFSQDVLAASRERGFYLKSMQKLCGKHCEISWSCEMLWPAASGRPYDPWVVHPQSLGSEGGSQSSAGLNAYSFQYPISAGIMNTLLWWASCGSWVIVWVSWIWVSLYLSQHQHCAPMKVSHAQNLLSFNPFYSPETALKSHKWSSNESSTWKLKTLL